MHARLVHVVCDHQSTHQTSEPKSHTYASHKSYTIILYAVQTHKRHLLHTTYVYNILYRAIVLSRIRGHRPRKRVQFLNRQSRECFKPKMGCSNSYCLTGFDDIMTNVITAVLLCLELEILRVFWDTQSGSRRATITLYTNGCTRGIIVIIIICLMFTRVR
jgi:hypothetical protein